MPELIAKEEIVLCFYKDGVLVAIEQKSKDDTIQRFMTAAPKWANTIDLFEARKTQAANE